MLTKEERKVLDYINKNYIVGSDVDTINRRIKEKSSIKFFTINFNSTFGHTRSPPFCLHYAKIYGVIILYIVITIMSIQNTVNKIFCIK